MVNDPVSDLFTRIRNAGMRHADSLTMPASRFTKAIAEAMVRTGYLDAVSTVEKDGHPMIQVTLKYRDGVHVIKAVKQVSKQGLRRYSSYRDLRAPRHGGGILLLSTPAGILSNREARARGVGGELLCEIHS